MNNRHTTLAIMLMMLLGELLHGYIYDYKPEFVNEDLRLAAFGNLDLVIIEQNNEINAYDFGNSPAGVIMDNDYKSRVTLPLLYGFTVLGDESIDHNWHAYQLGIDGVYKYQEKFALGGAFAKINARDDGTYYDFDGYHEENTILGSVLGAWHIKPRLFIGFQASFNDLIEQDSTFYGRYDQETMITKYEPSILFTTSSNKWQIGMDYKYKKYAREYYDTLIVHDFSIPVIYSLPHLDLGMRTTLGTLPDSGLVKEFKIRSLYKLFFADQHLNIGAVFAYQSPIIYEDFYYAYTDDGYTLDMGFGLAYQTEQNWLLGMQYKKQIFTYSYTTTSYAFHKDNIGMGGEIILWDKIPVRLGYVNVSSDYTTGYGVLTWGSGVLVPNIDLEFALTHNMYIYKHGKNDYTDYDHIFGLAGYLYF